MVWKTMYSAIVRVFTWIEMWKCLASKGGRGRQIVAVNGDAPMVDVRMTATRRLWALAKVVQGDR